MVKDHRDGNSLLALPTELLVFIISLVAPLRERIKLRYVSRRLLDACETPSLWKDFIWPYYYSGDETRVNNMLKVCGQYVKKLSFPNHVTPIPKLVETLRYCSYAVQLSLPTTKLDCEQLGEILRLMDQLQSLDVLWEQDDLKQLLELIILNGMNLKELTIRKIGMQSYWIAKSMESWLWYWIMRTCIPHQLNIVVDRCIIGGLKHFLLLESHKSVSSSPPGCHGVLKLYSSLKRPMDLAPALPKFQVEFGQTASPSLVGGDVCGFSRYDRLLLTDSTHHNKAMYRASLQWQPLCDVNMNRSFTNVKNLTEFSASSCKIFSDHLVQLALVCPNLQWLDLIESADCLKSLKGLRTITSSCHNLKGLNLMCISTKNVENQLELWEILSEMTLTHLAVDLCMLLPSEEDQMRLSVLFQKCKNLRALKYSVHCDECTSVVIKSISILSYFPALVHLIHWNSRAYDSYWPLCIVLHHLVTYCKQLKYLIILAIKNGSQIIPNQVTKIHSYNLQQLYIQCCDLDVPFDFMSSISAHGGLVHVVLHVHSMTCEGITVLVTNSPHLLTFHGFIYDDMVKLLDTEANLKMKYFNRKLFRCGSYRVVSRLHIIEDRYKQPEELVSFW